MTKKKSKYVVDTCSLTAMRRVYPQDVFPSAWKKLDELAQEQIVISSELVLSELESQDDYVTVWAKANSENFLPLDAAVQLQVKEILKSHKNLVDLKRRKSSADPFIIALAMISGCTVVTEEKPSGGPPKIKIPDVCKAKKIECISLLEMFRRENLKL